MVSFTQDNRQCAIETPLGKDALMLEHFSGWEGFNEAYQYTAITLSEDSAIEGSQIVGKRVTIKYLSEDGYTRYFNGFVNRFQYLGQRDEPVNLAAYELSIVPWLWFLKNNSDCEIFQEKKAPDIIEKIFKDLGYTDYKLSLSETYAEREYCVQYNESDYDFVNRLMEEEGMFYYFQHTEDKHELVIGDAASAYFELEDFEVQYAVVGQTHKHHLTGWRHSYEFRPGKFAQKDFNFEKPTDKLLTNETSSAQYESNSKFEVYEYPGLYVQEGDGQRLARVRREQLDAEHDVAEGDGFYPSFSPGGKFSISKHQRQGEEGKSFVLSAVHTELNADYDFDASSKPDFRNSFRAIPADKVFRPRRKTPVPMIDGPQTAIVVTDGQEIVVDKHARVKVQFHWDRYGQKNVKSSCWIRVSQHHAGAGWGMIDIPRKDEEVIVSFLDGKPDRPIITGRVYNGDNQPPFSLDGAGNNTKNKTRRGNTTKSYEAQGFNEMTMDDTAGEEEIRIHAQYDMNTEVQHDQTVTVHNDRTKQIDNNESNTIGNDRETLVENNHTETVNNDQSITVNNNQTTDVIQNQTNTIGGAQSTTVGGAYSLSIGSGMTVDVGAQKEENIGSQSSAVIASNDSTQVGGNQELVVGGNLTQTSGGNLDQTVGGSASQTAAQQITLTAGMAITLQANTSLTLQCGASMIQLSPASVTITGPLVKLNC